MSLMMTLLLAVLVFLQKSKYERKYFVNQFFSSNYHLRIRSLTSAIFIFFTVETFCSSPSLLSSTDSLRRRKVCAPVGLLSLVSERSLTALDGENHFGRISDTRERTLRRIDCKTKIIENTMEAIN
jgi:hypothetical protein